MDTIKAQLLRIQQQLSGLSASQKMLTASLLAIMLMTMLFWGRFAGNAEMEPVMEMSLPPETVGQIQAALMSHGIKSSVVGDRVMVPADRKLEAVAMLAYSGALPRGGSNIWDEMIKTMSPWDTSTKTQAIQNHLRERMLSQAMTNFFPGVAKANVLINHVSERRVGGSLEPSASVQITTRGGERNMRALVEGVASTVASAVPGLTRAHVSIVIDGQLYRPHDSGPGFISSDVYEQTATLEKNNVDKIARLMPPNALVAVKVELDTARLQKTREIFDEKTSIKQEVSSETVTQESQGPAAPAADPGTVSNTSTANTPIDLVSAKSGPSNSNEKTKSLTQVWPGSTKEVMEQPPGRDKVVSAAVRIPRSYFVRKYKQSNASAKEPDDAALQPLVEQAAPGYRKDIKNCTGIVNDEAVSIDVYDDFDTILASAGDSSSKASGIGAMVSTHGKELVLGVLAVVSLFMVSMIVKKGPQAPIIVEPEAPTETPNLATAEALAGIVGGGGNAALDGMELDDDTVKAQQVVHQVSTMVKEDPDAAANLVKRWLNRS